ncbi:MAG TPA: hypothetical protein GX724_07640 [Fibrobacter sp.]|nr:hypothetical protein [Fibrobacter sp.]
MKRISFILLLLASFVLAAEPAAAVTPATTKDTAKVAAPAPKATPVAVVKKDTAKVAAPAPKATPVAEVKKDTAKVATPAPKATPVVTTTNDSAKTVVPAAVVEKNDSTKTTEVTPAANSSKTDSTVAEVTTVVPDSSAVDSTVAEITPVADSSAVDSSLVKVSTPKRIKVKKPKALPLVSAGGFEFDFNSDFEIQAGKVFWSSEDDPNGDNMEEWFGRASLSLLTKTENFNGKIKISIDPGNLSETATVVQDRDDAVKTEMRDILELNEAWAYQRTKYFNFKLGRWDNTNKNGDYFGGYVDGYLNGFKSTFDSENMLQFGFTPTENLSVEVAFISTGPHLNTGDLRAVARFSKLSGIEALDIDLSARTNLFDKVYSHKSDVRTTVSLKATAPIIAEKLFVFGEVAMLELGADSTEKYIDGNSIPRERKIPVDLKMPLTGGLLFQPGVIDRMILEVEYISDRYKTKYHSSSTRVKDLLTAFYIEKDLTDRFTLSAGFHSYGSSKDFMLSGNLIGRIN